ncbi:class I SAM-dependent methyltransferase [Nocardia sp. CY41]|uniref:class I SAM-dependent methyltransferase n=1 Tax=Nocardia sp. CY41 TaxID=2608686 RepID=UPI001F2E0420|nr:methyltransferase domain-containing protein [Nocardia sp. CY41]
MKKWASQLGCPTGIAGNVVARMLDRGNRSTVVAAVEAARVEGGQTVADIGFGGGVGLRLLLDRVDTSGRVHGIDISPTMITRAQHSLRTEIDGNRLVLHQAGMDRLPLPDASVDALISTNTVYFIEDLAPAFVELARVLRPSGRAILGVGDPTAMAKMPFTKHRFRLRPIADITATLNKAGLEVTEDRRLGEGDEAYHLLVCHHVR